VFVGILVANLALKGSICVIMLKIMVALSFSQIALSWRTEALIIFLCFPRSLV
jgi:hypothetical protein